MTDALRDLPGFLGEGLLGLLLAATVTGLVRVATRTYARRSMLGFGGDGVDVVLPASNPQAFDDHGVTRPTTGAGSVQALGEVARSVGHFYGKLRFTVHVSRLEGALDSDLICIGGPRANEVSKALLESAHIRAIPGFSFDDVAYGLSVGDRTVVSYDPGQVDGVPVRDMAVVVGTVNPFEPSNRALLCCGFTSYGTRGAAEWFFGKVMREAARKPWANPHGVPRRDDKTWVAVLEFRVAGGRVMCVDSQVYSFASNR